MIELSNRKQAEFWHRSYSAVDGLWFMKVEEKYGFDVALDIDNEVWKVLPKIQARALKAMGKVGDGMNGLSDGIITKLHMEGFAFQYEKDKNGAGFTITISRCPWHDLMVKSDREHLSGRVGSLICNTEYSAWCGEFGDDIEFELGEQVCEGAGTCVLRFFSTVPKP